MGSIWLYRRLSDHYGRSHGVNLQPVVLHLCQFMPLEASWVLNHVTVGDRLQSVITYAGCSSDGGEDEADLR